MKPITEQEPWPGQNQGGAMPTTHWSVVLRAANAADPHAQQALETLCRAYWYPLYAFLRRQGKSSPEAQDLTQGFFARLLQKERFGQIRPQAGVKFRSWLLDSLRHFVIGEWRKEAAAKRGGGQVFISINAEEADDRYHHEPPDPVDPEKLFERKWVMELLERVLARLEEKYAAKGKQKLFAELLPFVRGGDDPGSHSEIAARLGLKPNHVAVEVSRLRDRYEAILRAEVAETVATSEEVEEELRYLFSVITQ